MKTKKAKKTKAIFVRATPKEVERIKDLAKVRRQSMSAFILSMADEVKE